MTLTAPVSSPALEPPPEELCRIDGVAGILFQQAGRWIIQDMPFDEDCTEKIGRLAQEMCEGFRKARRPLRHVTIGYGAGGTLLVQSKDDAQLVLLLMGEADLDAATDAAADYLANHFKKRLRLPS